MGGCTHKFGRSAWLTGVGKCKFLSQAHTRPQPPRKCVPEISDSIPTFKKIMYTRGTPAAIHHIFSRAGEEFFGAGRPTVPHISREKKMGGGDIGKTSGRGGTDFPCNFMGGAPRARGGGGGGYGKRKGRSLLMTKDILLLLLLPNPRKNLSLPIS